MDPCWQTAEPVGWWRDLQVGGRLAGHDGPTGSHDRNAGILL